MDMLFSMVHSFSFPDPGSQVPDPSDAGCADGIRLHYGGGDSGAVRLLLLAARPAQGGGQDQRGGHRRHRQLQLPLQLHPLLRLHHVQAPGKSTI